MNFTKHSLKKIKNFVLAVVQWKFLKNVKLISYPIELTICPGNICNIHCELCPTGQNDKGRDKGLMSFKMFKSIIDECRPYLYRINLFNWGEPLMNKHIFEMIKYAKQMNIKVALSCNLNYFNENICSKLVESGLDLLIVSLYGASQKSVEKYQRGSNVNKVFANMKQIISERKRLKVTKPKVQWKFLINKYNQTEIPQAVLISRELGIDELKVGSKFRCDMGKELTLDNESQYNNVKAWLPDNEVYSMYSYSQKSKKKLRGQDCTWLWLKSTINWNGSVSPCCAVWPEKYDFGDFRNSSFFEIWNNHHYQHARNVVRGRKKGSTGNICEICYSNKAQI